MSNGPFADFQNEVYLNGLLGVQPPLPFGWRDVRDKAYAIMTPQAVGYVEGSAGAEDTALANRQAFSDMVRDPAYGEGTHLRTEALEEAVLQATVPWPTTGG